MHRNNCKKNLKGFTLAELLVVVAIIAVLASVSIPIFNVSLERSKESKDLANIRAAVEYIKEAAFFEEEGANSNSFDPNTTNQLQVVAVNGVNQYAYYVAASQEIDGWSQTNMTNVAGISIPDAYKGGTLNGWVVRCDSNSDTVTVEAATVGE